MFIKTQPILGTRSIHRAIEVYTQRLGFELAFGDNADPPNYACSGDVCSVREC